MEHRVQGTERERDWQREKGSEMDRHVAQTNMSTSPAGAGWELTTLSKPLLAATAAETSLAHFHNVHNLLYLPDSLIVC